MGKQIIDMRSRPSFLHPFYGATPGTQEYEVKPHEFADRLAESYGDEAADEVLPLLTR